MTPISLKKQLHIWTKVALGSFGGPVGQISVIHKVAVEENKIISEEDFSHALNFCMFLPGPEAQQLATYIGWKSNQVIGGLIAGLLFILPGFLSILALSYFYVLFGESIYLKSFFYGAKPAIIAIVLVSLVKLTKKSVTSPFLFAIFILSFLGLFFFNISFPIIILSAAIFGILYGRIFTLQEKEFTPVLKPKMAKTILTLSLCSLAWFTPILITAIIFGDQSILTQINLFFSKMSIVTFGGAYSALTYVAQKAVDGYAWLTHAQMIDGLAMAETTPGPLIQSVQFVGFMATHNSNEFLGSLYYPFIASILTTWMTFAPCFLWIFTFAPYIEFIRNKKIFSDALKAISAAVTGVILNLSLWFGINTLFAEVHKHKTLLLEFIYPTFSSLDYFALMITFISFVLLQVLKRSLNFTILIAILIGFLKFYFKF